MVLLQRFRSHVTLASLALWTLASTQQINLLSGAPACAQSCTALTGAQTKCQQQDAGAPIDTIAACFCTDADATQLRTNPQICASSCTASQDQNNAMTWFAALCQNPGTITAVPAAAATSAAGGNTAIAATATRTQTAAAQATTNIDNNNAANAVLDTGSERSWWDGHARWVAMVIVLIVGFTIIIIVGVCLKKRATRKRNERGGSMPSSAAWGPQQSHPSLDHYGTSNSIMALNRGAEKYDNGRPTVTRMQTEMSGALQPSGSQTDIERNRSRSRNNGKRIKKFMGR